MSLYMRKRDLFASFDVEAGGDCFALYSMLSIGVVLFNDQGEIVSTFYEKLLPRENTTINPKTKRDFWDKHPDQWLEVNTNQKPPRVVIRLLGDWLAGYTKQYTIKWVSSPSCFDWQFLKNYYELYKTSTMPHLSFYCLDLSAMLRTYRLMKGIVSKPDKDRLLAHLSEGASYTHNALDDALYQGKTYMNLRKLIQIEKMESFRKINQQRKNVSTPTLIVNHN